MIGTVVVVGLSVSVVLMLFGGLRPLVLMGSVAVFALLWSWVLVSLWFGIGT